MEEHPRSPIPFGMTPELARAQLTSQRAVGKQIEQALRGGARSLAFGGLGLLVALALWLLETAGWGLYVALAVGAVSTLVGLARLTAAAMLGRRRPVG